MPGRRTLPPFCIARKPGNGNSSTKNTKGTKQNRKLHWFDYSPIGDQFVACSPWNLIRVFASFRLSAKCLLTPFRAFRGQLFLTRFDTPLPPAAEGVSLHGLHVATGQQQMTAIARALATD